MQSLGINMGSTSLKVVLVEDGKVVNSYAHPHEGDFESILRKILSSAGLEAGVTTLVAGNDGRFMLNIASTLESICIEAAVKALNMNANAVVSLGGEDIVVYLIADNKIVNSFSGNKCSSGTGEFLKQQLARMDKSLDDLEHLSPEAKVHPLSTRCSVFMKSDCTHKLNKHEATKDDIALSLCDMMATKVIDFLQRAKIFTGKVLLTGGITLNKHVVRFIKEKAPDIEFIIPDTAHIFVAYGAALLAQEFGSPLPSFDKLINSQDIKYDTLPPLSDWTAKVQTFNQVEGKVKKDSTYILGVDGGSTTTKACLVDYDTNEVVASHYGRTHGNPVNALKECLQHIQEKIIADTGGKDISIKLVATTGSSREILGVFLETQGVYNEITAHSVGTTYFAPDVETIFEIGGQDAKYMLLKNGVPIDYAMNEACSAGTGSFLEESVAGDLSIHDVRDIGPIAIKAATPLKFGEHCSAFINSDIRKAVQQGASQENIIAGIVCSIVSNYLNRVVCNRTIGKKIFLQGGVAKNPAVPLAFAMLLGKEILIPPMPELMGCFGVALLAKQKYEESRKSEVESRNENENDNDDTADTPNTEYRTPNTDNFIDAILAREIEYEKTFACQACDNLCPIQVLNVSGHRYMFGGRCNKYTNMRRKTIEVPVFDYIEKRQKLLFEEFAAPNTENRTPKTVIGIPRALSVHSLYPFYSWYFNELGIDTYLSEHITPEGVAKTEAEYCFPAEIAHGAVQDCLDKGVDFIFLPHFKDMESFEDDVHACLCPITQSLPYYIEKAFPDVDKNKWLQPVISFKFGEQRAFEFLQSINSQLGITTADSKRAFKKALEKQKEYIKASLELGKQALEDAQKAERPVIAIMGRPYNAFTDEANMSIPQKFTTRGYSVIPFDILPIDDVEIYPNMYWYYGQQVMKAATMLKEKNIYLTYVTNFSCAPDSFILHYIGWIMGDKPFLVLELDNHTADAGIDTRIEAFLDIINSYNQERSAGVGVRCSECADSDTNTDKHSKLGSQPPTTENRYDNGWKFVYEPQASYLDRLRIDNHLTGERVQIRNNKRVKILLSNMGAISTDYLGASIRSQGIYAEVLPVATGKTLHTARSVASGKECVPNHLVLGSFLEFYQSEKYKKDELYLLFVPITTGPCRTGQYYIFYENLFKDMKIDNVVVFILSSDNSYTELDKDFGKELWKGLIISDYLKDIQNALLTTAENPTEALQILDKEMADLVYVIEHKPKQLWKQVNHIAQQIRRIPLRLNPTECPFVLVVGEIYVRRDDFAISELTNLISQRGIIVRVAGISEWIYYLDYQREQALRDLLKTYSPLRRIFSKAFIDLQALKIEMAWKKSIENKVISIFKSTGLIPNLPHDMKTIMKYAKDHFINLELESEITVSSGAAAVVMESGFSGVINISPFACLIGRVIEGIFTPWARDRNYPILSVEIDGFALPPNTISKLNIFMLNVLRFKGNKEISTLIDRVASD